MAISQKTMTVGPFTLGSWRYDCAELVSTVHLRKHRPAFQFQITVGKSAKDVLSAGLKALGGDTAEKIGDAVGRAAPEFSGSITVVTSAEPVVQVCDPEKQKQTVGWDYVVLLVIKGTIKVSGVEVELVMELPFAGEGDRVECECNPAIDLDKVAIGPLHDSLEVTMSDSGHPVVWLPSNRMELLHTVALRGHAVALGGFASREEIAVLSPEDLSLPPAKERSNADAGSDPSTLAAGDLELPPTSA